MIPELRKRYNQSFTAEKYDSFLQSIEKTHNHKPSFRLSETPVFIPDILRNKLLEACQDIQKVILRDDFKELTKDAIKQESLKVPAEDEHPQFLQMDFGICLDENGDLHPQLIELQGFPSLYFFQVLLSESYKNHFDIPEEMTTHPSGETTEEYVEILRKIILGNESPENVILLEVEPEKQNTAIDFLVTEHYLGIKILCITKLKKDGRKLYYQVGS